MRLVKGGERGEHWAFIKETLRYYIIDLQESPKINFLSMNHCSHDLNELLDQP